jgi:hypothetical protein
VRDLCGVAERWHGGAEADAFDETQRFLAGLAGVAADDQVSLIDDNERQIEAAGIDLASYISPGNEHTVVARGELYTEEVGGVRLIDWVTALVEGKPVGDDYCEACAAG